MRPWKPPGAATIRQMHLHAVVLLHAIEALPAEIRAFDDEAGVRLHGGEAPPVGKRMHDGHAEGSIGAHHTPDFLQGRRQIIDVHRDVARHEEVELAVSNGCALAAATHVQRVAVPATTNAAKASQSAQNASWFGVHAHTTHAPATRDQCCR